MIFFFSDRLSGSRPHLPWRPTPGGKVRNACGRSPWAEPAGGYRVLPASVDAPEVGGDVDVVEADVGPVEPQVGEGPEESRRSRGEELSSPVQPQPRRSAHWVKMLMKVKERSSCRTWSSFSTCSLSSWAETRSVWVNSPTCRPPPSTDCCCSSCTQTHSRRSAPTRPQVSTQGAEPQGLTSRTRVVLNSRDRRSTETLSWSKRRPKFPSTGICCRHQGVITGGGGGGGRRGGGGGGRKGGRGCGST